MKQIDKLLSHSRFSQMNDGSGETTVPEVPPTSGQKWWASILFGIIFGILSSPSAYNVTGAILGYPCVMNFNFSLWILHVIIFILVIRLILW